MKYFVSIVYVSWSPVVFQKRSFQSPNRGAHSWKAHQGTGEARVKGEAKTDDTCDVVTGTTGRNVLGQGLHLEHGWGTHDVVSEKSC